MKEFEALSRMAGLSEILENTTIGLRLRFEMSEDIKDEVKPPSWVKGYEAIWWAAVARYVGDKDPDSIKGDGKAFGGITMIFKAYLKRATGYSIDDIKAANGGGKAGNLAGWQALYFYLAPGREVPQWTRDESGRLRL